MSLPNAIKPIYVDSIGNVVITNSVQSPFSPSFLTHYHVPLDNGDVVIQFQIGDPKQNKRNGLTNEVLIAIVLHHIAQQNKMVGNVHNVKAMEHLTAALAHLDARTLQRQIGNGFQTAV